MGVGPVDQGLHLIIDGARHLLGVALGGLIVPSDENLAAVQIGNGAQRLAHAVACHHVPGQLGCPVDVVGRAHGNVADEQSLRHPAAQQRDNLLIHLIPGQVGGIIPGETPGGAKGLAPGDDGDVPHRVMGGQVVHGNGVACLMDGRFLQILPGLDTALFRGTGGDLHQRLVQILHVQHRAILPGSQDGSLVEKVAQIRAGKTGSGASNGFQVHGSIQLLILGVYLENVLTALHVRASHLNLPVKPAGAQQCRIQNVRAVGGSQHNDALGAGEAVHLHQQLVQSLLLFVVSAAQAGAPLAAHRVDLIDEHNGGSDLLGLFKQVTNTAGADANIHFHKVGAGNGQKLHPGLSCHRPGKQGLAGAGRAYQQQAVGNPGADLGELLGVFQEVYNLLQFLLFLVRTGNVRKGDLFPVGHTQNGAGLAEIVQGITVIGTACHEAPGKQQHQSHNQ